LLFEDANADNATGIEPDIREVKLVNIKANGLMRQAW
jgi:hypothetical protein